MKFDEVLANMTKERTHLTDFFFEGETLNQLFKESDSVAITKDGILEIKKGDDTIGVSLREGYIGSRKSNENCYAKVMYAGTYKCKKIDISKKYVEIL